MLEKSSLRNIIPVITLSIIGCETTEENMQDLLAEAEQIVDGVRDKCALALQQEDPVFPSRGDLIFTSSGNYSDGGCACRNWRDDHMQDEYGYDLIPIGCTFFEDKLHGHIIFDRSRREPKTRYAGRTEYTAKARAGHIDVAVSSTIDPKVCELHDSRRGHSGEKFSTADRQVVQRCATLRQKIRASIQMLAGIAKQKLHKPSEWYTSESQHRTERYLDKYVIRPLDGTY